MPGLLEFGINFSYDGSLGNFSCVLLKTRKSDVLKSNVEIDNFVMFWVKLKADTFSPSYVTSEGRRTKKKTQSFQDTRETHSFF